MSRKYIKSCWPSAIDRSPHWWIVSRWLIVTKMPTVLSQNRRHLVLLSRFDYATALPLAVATAGVVLFLLPGGRPRRFTVISDIQAGGLPRRLTLPRASRSRLKIASSICARSSLNSVRIFDTSIFLSPSGRPVHPSTKLTLRTVFAFHYTLLLTGVCGNFAAISYSFSDMLPGFLRCYPHYGYISPIRTIQYAIRELTSNSPSFPIEIER